MLSSTDLDRLLVNLDVTVQSFSQSEVKTDLWFEPRPAGLLQVHYVVGGVAIVTLGARAPRRCGTGTMILVPPTCPVRIARPRTGPKTKLASGVVVAQLSDTLGLLDRFTAPLIEPFDRSPLIRNAFLALVEEIRRSEGGLASDAMASALMKLCLLTMLRRFFQRPGIDLKIIGALASPQLRCAIAAILDQPSAPHSVGSLADRANLGRSTFSRMFTASLGQAPMEFVLRTRLYHAAKILRTSTAPVKSIAAAVGFSSRSHFSRAFSEAYGCDPTAYRQREAGIPLMPQPQDLAVISRH